VKKMSLPCVRVAISPTGVDPRGDLTRNSWGQGANFPRGGSGEGPRNVTGAGTNSLRRGTTDPQKHMMAQKTSDPMQLAL
jgi:hypothetical protein